MQLPFWARSLAGRSVTVSVSSTSESASRPPSPLRSSFVHEFSCRPTATSTNMPAQSTEQSFRDNLSQFRWARGNNDDSQQQSTSAGANPFSRFYNAIGSGYIPLRSSERSNEEEAYFALSRWERCVRHSLQLRLGSGRSARHGKADAVGNDGQATGLWSVLDWGGSMLLRCVHNDTHDCITTSQVRARVQVCLFVLTSKTQWTVTELLGLHTVWGVYL